MDRWAGVEAWKSRCGRVLSLWITIALRGGRVVCSRGPTQNVTAGQAAGPAGLRWVDACAAWPEGTGR